ncbi:MAG TPA: diguanylate cyclase [Candidatus Acidoferrales bacterium]|nr:diguanylate cyclase [Candidatus Acidoferrales bacterium]
MKILIADDDPVSSRVLEVFLRKWGYEVVAVADGSDALAILEAEHAPRLAILDWMMPGMEGVEVCRRVRQRAGRAYVYLLLLTARGQKQHLLDGLDSGADDYLCKPFDADELRARLHSAERILAVQDELIAARDALHEQATHDALTGLMNRGASVQLLIRELARATRERRSLGIVMGDLDHFKNVNDSYGHLAGDAVLQEAAARMTVCVRSYDTVARYGGEEFLIIVPSATEEVAFRLAERMRAAIEASTVHTSAGDVPITASFGVASYNGRGSDDVTTLMRLADAALYRAKNFGRNCVERASRMREPDPSTPFPLV